MSQALCRICPAASLLLLISPPLPAQDAKAAIPVAHPIFYHQHPMRLVCDDVTINGHPAIFYLDTGAPISFIVSPPAAKSLGIPVLPPLPLASYFLLFYRPVIPPSAGLVGWGSKARRQSITIVSDLAPMLGPLREAKGLVGWPEVKKRLLMIAPDLTVTELKTLPASIGLWQKFPIRELKSKLSFDLPNPPHPPCRVLIDTGSFYGVTIGAELWREWKARHPSVVLDLIESSYPIKGSFATIYARETHRLCLGSLELNDVPVSATLAVHSSWFPPKKWDAIWGLAALQRMNLIIDGPHGTLYIRPEPALPPKKRRPAHSSPCEYLFLPDPSNQHLVVHVLENSWLFRKGLRTGDTILKINDQPVSPGTWEKVMASLPPKRTQITLTLLRQHRLIQVVIKWG